MANPIITDQFRINNAIAKKEVLTANVIYTQPDQDAASPTYRLNAYAFLGRTVEWDDDSSPPEPELTLKNIVQDTWNHMIAAKKITDVQHVIPRRNWVSGTAYTEFNDEESNLANTNFYVLNTETHDVFKCIDNAGDANSTVAPTKPTDVNDIIETSDGYRWIYMYHIPEDDREKYLTTNWMPIIDETTRAVDPVDRTGRDGAIDHIGVASGGANYSQERWTGTSTLTQPADVTRITANTANNTRTLSIGRGGRGTDTGTNEMRGAILRTSEGEHYQITANDGSTITISVEDDDALPATNSPSITVSTFNRVDITPIMAQFGDSPTQAKAYARLTGGAVTEVVVYEHGSGYTSYSAEVIQPARLGITVTEAVLRNTVSPTGGHGSHPINELYGTSLMINVNFSGSEEGKVFLNNDFRQIGIVRNVLLRDGNFAALDTAKQTTTLELTSTSGFANNDVIVETTDGETNPAKAKIIETTDTQTLIIERMNEYNFSAGDPIAKEGDASVNGTIAADGVEYGELKPLSGEIVYLNNRRPITRTVNQLEDIKIILSF